MKTRLVITIEQELHEALRLEAALRNQTMAAIVEGFISENLTDTIHKVRERTAINAKSKAKAAK